MSKASKDFYDIMALGRPWKLVRVTKILGDLFAKPGLLYWSGWEERKDVVHRLRDICTRPGVTTALEALEVLTKELPRALAFMDVKDDAADIGTQAHALIQWHTRKMLGLDVEVEPAISDEAMRCVLAWMEWVKDVDFTPLYTERIVWCTSCCVAGTTDVVATVRGVLSLLDVKSSKAVYPEALVQVSLYKHLLRASHGIAVEQACVLRLPKAADHPPLECVTAPPIAMEELHALLAAWRLLRRLQGATLGDVPSGTPCQS